MVRKLLIAAGGAVLIAGIWAAWPNPTPKDPKDYGSMSREAREISSKASEFTSFARQIGRTRNVSQIDKDMAETLRYKIKAYPDAWKEVLAYDVANGYSSLRPEGLDDFIIEAQDRLEAQYRARR